MKFSGRACTGISTTCCTCSAESEKQSRAPISTTEQRHEPPLPIEARDGFLLRYARLGKLPRSSFASEGRITPELPLIQTENLPRPKTTFLSPFHGEIGGPP